MATCGEATSTLCNISINISIGEPSRSGSELLEKAIKYFFIPDMFITFAYNKFKKLWKKQLSQTWSMIFHIKIVL